MSGDEDKKKGKKEESYTHMYDIATERIQPRRGSAITDALRREDEELANEAERLRLQELIGERRKKVDELKAVQQQGQQASTGVASPVALLMSMLIAQGMDPAKVNEYIKALDNESLMKLSMLGGQNSNSLLPIALMMQQGKSSSNTVQDAVATTKAILDIAKPANNAGGDMLTELVTKTIPNMQVELAKANSKAYEMQIENLRKDLEDLKPMDPLDYVKKVRDAASALGMSTATTNLEIEKLRLEDARHDRELKAGQETTKTIISGVKDIIEGPAGDVLQRLGGAAADRLSGTGGTQHGQDKSQKNPPKRREIKVLRVTCGLCGAQFNVPLGTKTAKCPGCNSDIDIVPSNAPPGEGTAAENKGIASFNGKGSGSLTPVWSGPPQKDEK